MSSQVVARWAKASRFFSLNTPAAFPPSASLSASLSAPFRTPAEASPVRPLLSLSDARLRGAATRRLQRRREEYVQQAREQRTPRPKADEELTPLQRLLLNERPCGVSRENDKPASAAGCFFNPLKQPPPLEGTNLAHDFFVEKHRREAQRLVVSHLIRIRREKEGVATNGKQADSHSPPAERGEEPLQSTPSLGRERKVGLQSSGASDSKDDDSGGDGQFSHASLSHALAEVYVHHGERVQQLSPRPHAFTEAQVKFLVNRAELSANPLYPAATAASAEEAEKESCEERDSMPSTYQLERLATSVDAPGMAALQGETRLELAALLGEEENALPENNSGLDVERSALERKAPRGVSPKQGSLCQELFSPQTNQTHEAEEAAPSVVLASGSRALQKALFKRGSLERPLGTIGDLPEPSLPSSSSSSSSSSSLGRQKARRRREASERRRDVLSDPLSAPSLLQATTKADLENAEAEAAIWGESKRRQGADDATAVSSQSVSRRHPFEENGEAQAEFSAGEVDLGTDAFCKMRERKRQDALRELWDRRGATWGVVNDCELPFSFVKGGALKGVLACASGCALFDVSFLRVFEVRGRDRVAFVDLVSSCDVQRDLRVGDAQPCLLFDTKGLVLDSGYCIKKQRSVALWLSGYASSHVFEYLASLANYCRSAVCEETPPPRETASLHSSRVVSAAELLDPWERPLLPSALEALPFFSSWLLKLKTRDFEGRERQYTIDCLRAGLTGNDGIEFALDDAVAPALCNLLLEEDARGESPHAFSESPEKTRGGQAEEGFRLSQEGTTKKRVAPPVLGCLDSWQMLRVAAGMAAMGVDFGSTHTAPQTALSRQVSLFKVRNKILLGWEALGKQLARPPLVRRVAFLVGPPPRLRRALRLCREIWQLHSQGRRERPSSRGGETCGPFPEPSFFGRLSLAQQQTQSPGGREAAPFAFPLAGQDVLSSPHRRPVGRVTSVVWNPWLQCRVAQGMVLQEFARHGQPVLFAVPTEVSPEKSKKERKRILKGGRQRVLVEGLVHRLPVLPHLYPLPKDQIQQAKEVPFSAVRMRGLGL